jgi:membrane associated rhomboid family serine protease
MGSMVQDAASPMAGYEKGYILLGSLMIVGGLIGAVFIRPEADRKRLAMRAVAMPRLAPANA